MVSNNNIKTSALLIYSSSDAQHTKSSIKCNDESRTGKSCHWRITERLGLWCRYLMCYNRWQWNKYYKSTCTKYWQF